MDKKGKRFYDYRHCHIQREINPKYNLGSNISISPQYLSFILAREDDMVQST